LVEVDRPAAVQAPVGAAQQVDERVRHRANRARCAGRDRLPHMANDNQQFRLAARPVGMVKREDFELVSEPAAEPGEDEVLVEVSYISLDPAMRGWMNDARSYVPPVGLGEVMRAGAAGRVIASNAEGLSEGDTVTGMLGVQRYATVKGSWLTKVDT